MVSQRRRAEPPGEQPGARPGGRQLHLPRVVIAAPGSGHGKTSVATGLLAAYRARGLAVSPHKVGPDYIDPGYHALAAGRVGRNLDPWLVGEQLIAPLFVHGATTPVPADIAVIEGVMGLFDGVAGHGSLASTAHVAELLQAPVLLVLDCTAMGRSVAAVVHGLASFDPAVRLGGVILNRIGSDRHEQIVRAALAEVGVPVLGAVRRQDVLATPSRHLGLVPAAERAAEAEATVAALGEVIGGCVDLEAILRLAASAPPLPPAAVWPPPLAETWPPSPAETWPPSPAEWRVNGRVATSQSPLGEKLATRQNGGSRGEAAQSAGPATRPVVALAGGAAFTFGYAEQAELLAAAGAEVVRVDPLRDTALPAGCAGLVIGGGFPEVHAEALSANQPLRAAVAELARAGAPIAAECAGLLYLARSLDGRPMCGVLDVDAAMTDRLQLGYRAAVAPADSVLAPAGARVHGHEFHRTACTPAAGALPAWRWLASQPGATTNPARVAEGFVQDAVHASYLHLHWAGVPGIAERFVAACRARSAVPA